MYIYRVVESPYNQKEIIHEETFLAESEAKSFAIKTVRETKSPCYIERNVGEGWQRGNRRYFWYFETVCHQNY